MGLDTKIVSLCSLELVLEATKNIQAAIFKMAAIGLVAHLGSDTRAYFTPEMIYFQKNMGVKCWPGGALKVIF